MKNPTNHFLVYTTYFPSTIPLHKKRWKNKKEHNDYILFQINNNISFLLLFFFVNTEYEWEKNEQESLSTPTQWKTIARENAYTQTHPRTR